MTDQERAKVGTCYKKQGQDEAIKLGHQLVSGRIKDERMENGWRLPVLIRMAICTAGVAVCAARLCSSG